jgi:mannose-6-phosphate isomerase
VADPVFAIDGIVRRYEWGSRSAIQRMLEVEPDGRPAAELWFGAHPDDPSPACGSTLEDRIAADPADLLGAATVARFGPHLPFLLKVLAAERALSIQVHPTREQARAGFAAEQDAGGAERNYTDPNHKPELLCALTRFEALCGFRPVAETLALLDELAIPELGFVGAKLRGPDGLREAFTALLTHPEPAAIAGAVAARAREEGPLRSAWLAVQDFPGDIGVALTVLLNDVRLEPGQAIYLAAGNVHAYLRGTGVEIMANSDNVLRCGLTAKRIDVAELLKITDFGELSEPRWPAHDGVFRVPVPDFALRELRLDGAAALEPGRPSIVLCVDGRAEMDDVVIGPGHAAFVPASAGAVLRGSATVFVATTGD